MNEKEMIEEIRKNLEDINGMKGIHILGYIPLAEELVKQGYRKIPEDSVVVDKEYLKKELQGLEAQVRKETAKEILSKLFPSHNVFNDNDVLVIWQLKDILKELAKAYEVEVEE